MRTVPSSIASKLAAAGPLIAERGLADTKIDDVAAVTGVPKATLYYYFAGKEDILAFLLHDGLSAMGGAVAGVVDRPGSAAERLRQVIEAQLQVMAEYAAVSTALLLELGRAARIPEIDAAVDAAYRRPVAQLLREGLEDGSLPGATHVDSAVMAIFGAVTLTGLHHLVRGEEIPPSAGRRLGALLLDGLTRPPR